MRPTMSVELPGVDEITPWSGLLEKPCAAASGAAAASSADRAKRIICPRLLRLDPCGLQDLAGLFDFLFHEIGELRNRQVARHRAELGQPLAQIRSGQRGVDALVALGGVFGRYLGRSPSSDPHRFV